MRTFSIKTFGCKVNQYESQVIREELLAGGYCETNNNNNNVDFYIVNTCCVTDHAEKKARQYINRVRREFPKSSIVATGCAVKYKPEKFEKSSFLNIDSREKGISSFWGRTRAFVKVQDGCNEFCSYCVLPYIRGRSRSRNTEEILQEVNQLLSNGYREIVLTGIHLGDYKKLPDLLKLLVKLPDLARIRLSSLELQDVTDSILSVISRNNNICRHLHIPLQSGSDNVLKQMNRRYTYLEYKKIIGRIRGFLPDITFTTDVIVGFPGEAEKDFLGTCNAVKEIGFVKVHVFPYSDRPGTKASTFIEKVNRKEIKRRVSILKDIADRTAYEQKIKLIDSTQEVLAENAGGMFSGYTSGYIPVKIKGNVVKNELVKVKVTEIKGQYLIVQLLQNLKSYID